MGNTLCCASVRPGHTSPSAAVPLEPVEGGALLRLRILEARGLAPTSKDEDQAFFCLVAWGEGRDEERQHTQAGVWRETGPVWGEDIPVFLSAGRVWCTIRVAVAGGSPSWDSRVGSGVLNVAQLEDGGESKDVWIELTHGVDGPSVVGTLHLQALLRVNTATKLSESLHEWTSREYLDLVEHVQRPNVLLLGKTGCGKSSLVNAIAGSILAGTGHVTPSTRETQRFECQRVVLYDTQGLEHDTHKDFLSRVEDALFSRVALPGGRGMKDHVHAVWYLVDLSQARFQKFESDLCRTLLANIPLFFVLCKADTASREQVASIRTILDELQLPNIQGIFEIVMMRQNYDVSSCPACDSANVQVKMRTKEVLCDSCHASTRVEETMGVESLVNATCSLLPMLVRHSFVFARQVERRTKVALSRAVIAHATRTISSVTSRNLVPDLSRMTARLFRIWAHAGTSATSSREAANVFMHLFLDQSLLNRFVMALSDVLTSRKVSGGMAVLVGREVVRELYQRDLQAVQQTLRAASPDTAPSGSDPSAFSLTHVGPEEFERAMESLRREGLDVTLENGLKEVLGAASPLGAV